MLENNQLIQKGRTEREQNLGAASSILHPVMAQGSSDAACGKGGRKHGRQHFLDKTSLKSPAASSEPRSS